MTIEMLMKQGHRPAKVTYAHASGYRIDKTKWKFIVYKEDGSEYLYTQNFDDVGTILIDGKAIPQCYWYDHEINKNNLYSCRGRLPGLSDAELAYCKADIQATFDAFNADKIKEEKNMKDKWFLYYARNLRGNDIVLIAQTYDDAIVYCKEVKFSFPVYMTEADSRDKYVKADVDDCSVLTVTEYPDGTACFATQKYADWIKTAKNNEAKDTEEREYITMPERNVQELLEEFDTEELEAEIKRRKEDEAWYNKFEQGMYYKVRDMRKEDSAFVILRFVGFDEDYDEFAQFENVYDHYMLWVPNPKLRRCNIDNYTITKLRDGMRTE